MFNAQDLAKLLRKLRRKTGISRNSLAKATGLSRRTLARIEAVTRDSSLVTREQKKTRSKKAHQSPVTSHPSTPLPSTSLGTGRAGQSRPPGLSPRTAFKLARALLGEEETRRVLNDATRLSRFLGNNPLYKFLDVLYHYPAFLFHRSAAETLSEVEGPDAFQEYARDYSGSFDLLLRSGFGTRNLGARLRAFRLQHDLTLVEAADLLDLSKSELHRLERAERSPSPRTRYRILRLLTLPSFSCHPELVEGPAFLSLGVQAAGTRRPQRLGRAGNASRVTAGIQPAARRASLEGSQACPVHPEQSRGEPGRGGNPRRVSLPPAAGGPTHPVRGVRSDPAAGPPLVQSGTLAAGLKPRPASSRVAGLRSRAARPQRLAALKVLLSLPPPPPKPGARSSDSSRAWPRESDSLDRLRHLWLAGELSARQLALQLGISQPHLIRLLRGDRRPSRALQARLESLLGAPGTRY